jgi:hypothetical protein
VPKVLPRHARDLLGWLRENAGVVLSQERKKEELTAVAAK